MSTDTGRRVALTEDDVTAAVGNDAAWSQLTADPEDWDAVWGLLLSLLASLRDQFTQANLEHEERVQDARDGVIGWETFRRLAVEHDEWRRRAVHFQDLVLRRHAALKPLREERNRARRAADHQAAEAAAAGTHRDLVRQLAVAIANHRSAVTAAGATCVADEALWDALRTITVPYRDARVPLQHLIDADIWTGDKPTRRKP
jgi:hypothetical protein